jgi:AcrR family transcriptional regulator
MVHGHGVPSAAALDVVPWIEAERYSGTIRNDVPEKQMEESVAENSAVAGNATPTDADPAGSGGRGPAERAPRRLRADAARNVDSLLEAAKAVFATSGVDAPAKEIADLAGVGVGTLYRHFPQRSDLVKAVFQRGVDACADAAPALAAAGDPAAALAAWLHRYTEFLATKRGLAAALHSGDPAFDALPGYFACRPSDRCSRRRKPAARSGPTSVRGSSCTPSPRCACRSRATASPTASAWWRS